jgi:hypothetical protein
MSHEELKEYLEAQLHEIHDYKWIESERRRFDIGFDRAAFEWIGKYGDLFHNYWMTQQHKTPKS